MNSNTSYFQDYFQLLPFGKLHDVGPDQYPQIAKSWVARIELVKRVPAI